MVNLNTQKLIWEQQIKSEYINISIGGMEICLY